MTVSEKQTPIPPKIKACFHAVSSYLEGKGVPKMGGDVVVTSGPDKEVLRKLFDEHNVSVEKLKKAGLCDKETTKGPYGSSERVTVHLDRWEELVLSRG